MSRIPTKNHHSTSAGFTLIELMISLILGLLISAAVIQVYIISSRTVTVQQSASEVQDSSIFALQSIEDSIRIANLGNPITAINDGTKNGGVVLTTNNLGSGNTTDTKFLTTSSGATGWNGLSNIEGITSDQLTIQYKNITQNSLFDCEGIEIAAGSSDWVVERYFVKLATAAPATGVRNLALSCDAGRIDSNGAVKTSFAGDGQIIVVAIDQFKVLLGVQTDISQMTYLSPKTYLELTDKPPITTVKIGVIVRSSTPLMTDTDKSSFTLLGQDQVLKTDDTRAKYYRRSYESTILLRNARIMNVVATASPAPAT